MAECVVRSHYADDLQATSTSLSVLLSIPQEMIRWDASPQSKVEGELPT